MKTTHPILGLDIGKSGLIASFPPDETRTPRLWPTVKIEYDNPAWWRDLLDLIEDDGIVAAEPTGAHLLAPVAAVLHHFKPGAALWQVDYNMAAHYRAAYVANAKNDRLDAIALCLIAQDIAAGKPPRAVRPFDHGHENAVQQLRLRVNTHLRLTKERTRTLNRLNVLSHGLWPSFAGSSTWLRAARAGAIDPAQVIALASDRANLPKALYRGNAALRLEGLASDIPPLQGDKHVMQAIADQIAALDRVDIDVADNLAMITAIIEAPPFADVTRRWRTLPGSGTFYLAAIHVASHGRVLEFSKDEFRAACGVTPTTSISGEADRTRNTNRGYRAARVALHLWTLALLSPSVPETAIRTYFQAGHSMAAAKNKLARVLWGRARDESL